MEHFALAKIMQPPSQQGFSCSHTGPVSTCGIATFARGPTLRLTPFASFSGRCAMKLRSAGHLERWGS